MPTTQNSPSIIAQFLGRLQSIPHPDPALTPETWCKTLPCRKIRFGTRELILTKPSSTFFVYFHALLNIGAGLYFLSIQHGELSRQWWGIALILWGVGAMLAGTSYQALAYHIKCAGRQQCAWTSWWEVIYLIIQQLGLNALLVAVAIGSSGGLLRQGLLLYAAVNAGVYLVLVIFGSLKPVKSLITFELLVLNTAPTLLIFLLLNGWRYIQLGRDTDLVLLTTWLLLLLTMAAYWLYDHLDLTARLWQGGAGIWFSQNDVLHIGLILWTMYVVLVVAPRVTDYVSLPIPG